MKEDQNKKRNEHLLNAVYHAQMALDLTEVSDRKFNTILTAKNYLCELNGQNLVELWRNKNEPNQ